MALRDEVVDLVGKMDRDVDAVIVEGKHDRQALERAGFTGTIYTCSSNTDGVVSLAHHVTEDGVTVAILTDFDAEGRNLCGTLRDTLPERRTRRIWRRKIRETADRGGSQGYRIH